MTTRDGQSNESGPTLPYQAWMERALRGVVATALEEVARNGLPGEHHFYITFLTGHPGSVLPERLRQKYPDEMTIVLQHQYSNLRVDRAAGTVSVNLSFGGVASTLVIPFDAITGFADPSVQFGLQFARAPLPDADDPFAPDETAQGQAEADAEGAAPQDSAAAAETDQAAADAPSPQVVSLDAFRRRRD